MTQQAKGQPMSTNHTAAKSLQDIDPDIAQVVADELERQQNTIELIASENIVSTAVMEAQGSVLTNKYAEGYPGRRYYGGCEAVDVAEELAKKRAQELFKTKYFKCGWEAGGFPELQRVRSPFDRTRLSVFSPPPPPPHTHTRARG